jgi:hypothetical protein
MTMANAAPTMKSSELAREVVQLDAELTAARTQQNEDQGALKQLMGQMKKDHGVTTIAQAKTKLKKLIRERDQALAKAESLLDKYRDEWDTEDDDESDD